MKEYTFSANNSSDPEEAKKVIAGLKRIARFGRHAEHVLKKIEEDGFYDGRGAYVEGPSSYYQLKINSFPRVEKITREHIAGFGNYSIRFADLKGKKRWGGVHNSHDQIPVYISGEEKLTWDEEKNKIVREPLNDLLGHIKLLKKGFSFRHKRDSYYDMKTYKIFTQHDSEGGKEAVAALAKNIAEKLVQYRRYGGNTLYIMKDLRKMIPRWLEKDGVIKKIFQDFKKYAGVQKIMSK